MATICAPTNACFSHNCPPQISIDTGMSLLASVGLFLCFQHTVWSCRVLLRPPDQSSSVTSVGIVGPHLDVNQYHTDLGLFPTDSFSIKTPFQIFFT
ncbi:LPS-assembly protein LptD [Trichinella pseudospiralis]